MNDDAPEDDIVAAEYVLGLTEASEIADLERRVAAEPDFARLVAAWEMRFLPAQPEPAIAPANDLWDRIEARLDQDAAAPATMTILLNDGVWEPWFKGVERKVLHVDAAERRQAYLVRMQAGAVLPAHRHGAHEHCVVVSGEISLGGVSFGAGAYHFASMDVRHGRITAETDAVFFIHGAL